MKIHDEPPTAKRTAFASTTADLREMKTNSHATVQELQAFLRELKGRSPQEMLGVVAASQLARSLGLATALVTGSILLFTAIPYFFPGKETQPPLAITTPETPGPAPTVPAAPAAPKADPLAPLGVGEQLTAPPNKNPLENKGDDFLKDLE